MFCTDCWIEVESVYYIGDWDYLLREKILYRLVDKEYKEAGTMAQCPNCHKLYMIPMNKI